LNRVVVLYTSKTGGGDIVYRISDATAISFGSRRTLIAGDKLNDVSVTKQNFTDELVAICSTDGNAREVVGVVLSAE